MIYTDPYTTTVGQLLNIKKTKTLIEASMVVDDSPVRNIDIPKTNTLVPLYVTGYYDSESNIPVFSHNVVFTNSLGRKVIAGDVRRYVKRGGQIKDDLAFISNPIEYEYVSNKLKLGTMLLTEGVEGYKGIEEFGGLVYSRWVSSSLRNLFHLDLGEELIVRAVALYSYQCLFYDEVTSEISDLIKTKIVRWLKVDNKFIRTYFKDININPVNIQDMTTNITTATKTIKLADLSDCVLLSGMSNTFYGINASEDVSISLEYLPGLFGMITKSTNRAYKNSVLSNLTASLGERGRLKKYLQELNIILDKYTTSKSTTFATF